MESVLTPPLEQSALAAIHDTEALSDYLRTGRSRLADSIRQGAGGVEAARAYSDLVDSVIRRMLALACSRAGRAAEFQALPVAVIATGGYGRRELSPHSDIDITFVPARDGDPTIDRVIKEMFTLVMRVFIDGNGLEVGYAYRLMSDCGTLDHQTISGLLDARLVAGSDRLFIQFEHEFWSSFNPAEFIFEKLAERRKQRQKAGESCRVVEPNLKEGPGGLRDLQTAVWVTQARQTYTAARVRGERAWEVLVRDAGVSPGEAQRLAQAKEFLLRVRAALHVLAGAERDQLVVTRQEEVAALLGYAGEAAAGPAPAGEPAKELALDLFGQDAPPEHPARAAVPCSPPVIPPPPVERFMRDYYAHAATVDRIATDAMRRAEESRLFLGIGLDCVRRQILPANPALAHEDPVWMLWACELAQKYDLEFADELVRAIVDLLENEPRIRDTRQAAEVFTRILGSKQGAYPILQRMADVGILGWILPEVGAIMNLIPYDPSHDYTVGQHTLYLIRHLDALRAAEGSEEMADLRRLMAELARPEELYLAGLLHDAGKIADDRPHSESGEDLARQVCRRLQWGEQATDNVCFLVRHHLLMAETSRLRDLNLEETIRDFTGVVNDLDRLTMLYLLTYADTRAVGEGVWTQVKARFLRDLYRRAERVLAAEEPEGFDDASLTRTRRRLLKELQVENLPPEEVAEHVESMPPTYLLNTSLEDMALHIGFVRRARAGEPVVDFHDERDLTYTEVTVCTLDDPRPGLLSKIAGVLYAADVDVHSAQVVTRVAGAERIAIDTLFVDFRGRQLTPGKRKEIASGLTAVLTGQATVEEVLARRRKRAQVGGPVDSVRLRNDLSETFTVVEIASQDERAMLYRASGALSSLGWDIHSARLSHFRGRSQASFYVTGARGMPEAEARRQLLRCMPDSAGAAG